MKQFIIALAATMLSADGGVGNGNGKGNEKHEYHGAPGPILGAGLPVLAIGYGVDWLVKRRRRVG